MSLEIENRRAAVVAELPGRKLDALIVGNGANLRYLTGFTGSSPPAWIGWWPDGALFFTDPRYTIQSKQEVSCRVRVSKGPLLPAIVKEAGRRKLRRIGFERSRITYDGYDFLRSNLPARSSPEPVAGLVEQRRMVKSESEIAAIRKSVETNSRAFEQAVAHVKPGVRENDLAAELEYRMRRLGAEKPSFETLVAGGVRSALPHAQPTSARLDAGSLVIVDMGAMQDGYASDMTRMLFIGRPGAKVKHTYRAVLEAQLAALAAVRPGISAGAVDRAARSVLKAHGLDKAFVHSTGHGLGLEIHEPPRLGKRDKTRLQKGMAITIEPGVYLEGFGGIRIEDTVIVTETGCEVLTPTSKELRVIEG